ncbi:hypothetical protein PCH_Pc12g03010 [Penicillium rubens Wisconsin 54-1255]|uniref:Uncharacterized protein n=1 Tax=Penicillium rubens (strain ATCC 28089 / DSM 1075 / NRRL 1951 / Wisconsin 54-1255) TaxID=500485 RepID=B6H0L0_PENRW|nr:hypothetical protein PCH_Pc12g03010 [Penicillium rubens Wisconsin 54-1255]
MWVMENRLSIKYPVLIQRSARERKCGPRDSISVKALPRAIAWVENPTPDLAQSCRDLLYLQFVSTIPRSTSPSAAAAESVRSLYIVHSVEPVTMIGLSPGRQVRGTSFTPQCETNAFALPAVKLKPLFSHMTQNETGDLPSLNELEGHGSLTLNLYLPDMPCTGYIGHIVWGQGNVWDWMARYGQDLGVSVACCGYE